ncbi:hypothetical protein [Lentzea xinjiangensis]|uniref:hypothetical protein n=1 Tax=Lentzea xinjiangensis TaxID=402600 RepID=UPI001160C8BF|nr:hypothetical protein [Lentzea xinjiangensis]
MLALAAGLVAFSVRFSTGLARLLLRRLDSRSDVTNQATCEVHGDVIQIGVVHGDLTIHQTCRRCRGHV